VTDTELDAARLSTDPEERARAFSAVANRQAHTPFSAANLYNALPPDQQRFPFPGGQPGTPVPSFPASKGQAGMPGGGQPATAAPRPTAPLPSAPLQSAQQSFYGPFTQALNQPNAPQPPAGQAPPSAAGPSGTSSAGPPPAGQGAPNIAAVTQSTAAITANQASAPVGSAPGVQGYQPPAETPAAPAVAFPDFTLSAGGVPPKDADTLDKQIDAEIQKLQKIAPANVDQATAQSELIAQRPDPASLRTKAGYDAARSYLRVLLGQTRAAGPQILAQEKDQINTFNKRLEPYQKGLVATGAEAAVDLPQLLREYDQAGVAQGGGRTDANGKPLYVNKLPAVLEAHREQINEIERRWQAGDREGASQLAMDVTHDLKRGWDPKAEAAVMAGLFKLFGNASTALAHDPVFIRGQLQKAGLADRFANVPDGELGELFFGARAEKGRQAITALLPRLKGLSPEARQPAIDALAGYSKIADPKAPPVEIDPADFDRLTPYEKARVAASNVRLAIAQNRQNDQHQNALSLRALREAQMARLNALMNNPNAKGAKNGVLTPNAQVHVEAQLWNQADRGLQIWYRQDPQREKDKYQFLNRPENAALKAYLDSDSPTVAEPKFTLQFQKDDDPDVMAQTMVKELTEHRARMKYIQKALTLGPQGNPLDHFPQPPNTTGSAGAALPGGGPPGTGVKPAAIPATQPTGGTKVDPAAFRYSVEMTVRHGGDRFAAIQHYRARPDLVRAPPPGWK